MDDFMKGKKPLVKRHISKSDIRRVDFHDLPQPEVESSDHSTIVEPQREEPGFMNDFDKDMEDRTVNQIITLGCDVSVSKKVVSDTLDQIEELGRHPAQPGRTARVEVFYFISHIMQSHSRQMLFQQASNPFKNPRHMAVVMTRLMEIYLAGNPSIRFLIITYPMHHLSLMLALRDHIGADIFKVVAIVPAPPFGRRSSSLRKGPDGKPIVAGGPPTKPEIDATSYPLSNPFLTPDEPSSHIGKPDFVLYTTSPQDTLERVPIRIDLLIEEIAEFVNPPEDDPHIMAPRPAVSWDPQPTGLPHPLSNVTRPPTSSPLEPIDLDAAVRYETSKLMAKYQYQRLKRYPGAPPRTPEVVNAQWEHIYKKLYKELRKIRLVKARRALGDWSFNPSDEEKADDEGDSDSSELDAGSIISLSVTSAEDDTGPAAANDNPFDSYVVPDDASIETAQCQPVDSEEPDTASVPAVQQLSINSNEEPCHAGGSSPPRYVRRRFSFSPLSMSYSFEKKSSDRQSGFWEQYAQDHL